MAFFLLLLFVVSKSEILTTITNSSGSYYLATEIDEFRSNTISCNNSLLCYIECENTTSCSRTTIITQSVDTTIFCNGEYSCNLAKLYLENTTNINIYCNGAESCNGADLISGMNTNTVNINCMNDKSCLSASWILTYTKTINIMCSGGVNANSLSGSACWLSEIYAEMSDNFYLSCIGNVDCIEMNIFCPSIKANTCHISCYEGGSCRNTNIMVPDQYTLNYLNITEINIGAVDNPTVYCFNSSLYPDQATYWGPNSGQTNLISSYGTGAANVVCEYEECCPFYRDGTDTVCSDDMDCTINCDQKMDEIRVWKRCGKKTINASKALSLDITCNDYHSCEYLDVICPDNNNAFCNIICNGTGRTYSNHQSSYPCSGINVTAASSKLLTLSCINLEACDGIKMDSFQGTNIDISCYDEYSCRGVFNLNYAGNINILCEKSDNSYDDGSCYGTIFYLENTEMININCVNDACKNAIFYGYNAKSLNMTCNHDALYTISLCNNVEVYCPYKGQNSCNIDCSVSCDGLSVIIEDDFDVDFFNIKCVNNLSIYDESSWGLTVSCDGGGSNIKGDICQCDDSQCCPILNDRLCDNITSTNDCIINCNNLVNYLDNNYLQKRCWSAIIDASDYNSLDLTCSQYGVCKRSKIYCPTLYGSKCNIHCDYRLACIDSSIYFNGDNTVNLECLSQFACSSTILYIAAMNSNVNLKCMDQGCTLTTIYIDNGNTVNINCTGQGACSSLNLVGNIKNDINIYCYGSTSCTSMKINNTASSFNTLNIYCANNMDNTGTIVYGACHGAQFYGIQANIINIVCEDKNECNYMLLSINDIISSFNLDCMGEYSCQYTTILVPSNRENLLKVNCNYNTDYSCTYLTIQIKDNFIVNFVDISCSSALSCQYIQIECELLGITYLEYNDLTQELSCSGSKICCPFGTRAPTLPTQYPSLSPSEITIKPTNQPSSAPTIPTNAPITAAPITAEPSKLPTSIPTLIPIKNGNTNQTGSIDKTIVLTIISCIILVLITIM